MMPDQYRPKFTTSASKQEERKEERKYQGYYFGARVKTVSKGYEEPNK